MFANVVQQNHFRHLALALSKLLGSTIQFHYMCGNGSYYFFFQMSDIPTYKRMWSFMEANQDTVFVNNTVEGVERVLNSDYAYLAESPTIDYIVQKNCKKLTQIGGLLDSKGYGIATPKGLYCDFLL